MQNSEWIALFKLLPPETHNVLVLTTQSGNELSVDTILRTEPTYLVMRGRLMGTTDEGRAFFVPYDQLAFVNLNRIVKEHDVAAFYGEHMARVPSPLDGGSLGGASEGRKSSPAISIPPPAPHAPVLPSTPSALPGAGRGFPGVRLPGLAAQSSGGSSAGLPHVPAAALVPPSRPGSSPMMPNVPAAALIPPPPPSSSQNGSGDTPIPPRNSILERLRAQRNSMIQRVPPR